jgi:hypothetical protein
MHNKRWLIMLACVLAVSLAITGCSTKKDPGPREATLAAIQELALASSYEFNKTFHFNELSTNILLSDQMEESELIFSFLNKSQVNMKGVYQKNPFRIEMTIEFITNDEILKSFLIPVLITADKTYIQITDLPKLSIPPEYLGKYIEIDYGEEWTLQGPIELKKLKESIVNSSITQFDEETFFKRTSKLLNAIPPDIDAQQVFTFSVTEDTMDQFVNVLIKEVMPNLLELLSDNANLGYVLSDNDINEMQQKLNEIQDKDIQSWVHGLKESFELNNFQTTTAIDKAGVLRFQETVANMAFLRGNDFFKLDMISSEQYNKLNEPVQFSMRTPTDVIPRDELEALLKKLELEMNSAQNDAKWKP